MGVARAAVELTAVPAAVERLWSEPEGWAGFVDGFGHVVELDPAWPAVGARLTWESHAGGRGRVVEQVIRQVPGQELVVTQEDAQLRGVQRLAFAPVAADPDRIGVALELDYALIRSGPFMVVADPLFVRRALRDSLRRTLAGLARALA